MFSGFVLVGVLGVLGVLPCSQGVFGVLGGVLSVLGKWGLPRTGRTGGRTVFLPSDLHRTGRTLRTVRNALLHYRNVQPLGLARYCH